jgi:uncharacterized protein YndB with AHSA1/START domain
MASAAPDTAFKLKVKRTFQAPIEKVFAAWTERGHLEKLMCRDATNDPRYIAFDMRPGGTNKMEIRIRDGSVYHQHMTFREINPPEKLVFTWGWQKFSAAGTKLEEQDETLVTVDFRAQGNRTELLLTHEGFQNAEQCERHRRGWTTCLEMLEKALA